MFFFPRSRRLKSVPCIILYREYFYMRSNYFLEFFLHVFFQAQKCKKSLVWKLSKVAFERLLNSSLDRFLGWEVRQCVEILLYYMIYYTLNHYIYLHTSILAGWFSRNPFRGSTSKRINYFIHFSTSLFLPLLRSSLVCILFFFSL